MIASMLALRTLLTRLAHQLIQFEIDVESQHFGHRSISYAKLQHCSTLTLCTFVRCLRIIEFSCPRLARRRQNPSLCLQAAVSFRLRELMLRSDFGPPHLPQFLILFDVAAARIPAKSSSSAAKNPVRRSRIV